VGSEAGAGAAIGCCFCAEGETYWCLEGAVLRLSTVPGVWHRGKFFFQAHLFVRQRLVLWHCTQALKDPSLLSELFLGLLELENWCPNS